MLHAPFIVVGALVLLSGVQAIGQETCVTFSSSTNSFPVVANGKAAPIYTSSDDWPAVQIAAANFASDIQKVTGVNPVLTNVTSMLSEDLRTASIPIIIGTLGNSSLISQVINATHLDVSSIEGQWESFLSQVVQNPLPGVSSAYVIIGADRRGTVFALYDLSEQFGAYWVFDSSLLPFDEALFAS